VSSLSSCCWQYILIGFGTAFFIYNKAAGLATVLVYKTGFVKIFLATGSFVVYFCLSITLLVEIFKLRQVIWYLVCWIVATFFLSGASIGIL
jgi:hypothetical protein